MSTDRLRGKVMVNVNDIYKESEDSCLRVHKATREELESMYGKEMVKELLDGKGVIEHRVKKENE